jgi:hypothetical protein
MAGWPARFGLAGGRKGLPPPIAWAAPGAFIEPGCPGGRGAGGRGAGILGIGPPGVGFGRGSPGLATPGLGEPRCSALGLLGLGLLRPGWGKFGLAWMGLDGADGVRGVCTRFCGRGCLGPVRICPGFGAGGPGRDGMATPRGPGAARGGAMGCPAAEPAAMGGRKGAVGRAATGGSTVSLGTSGAGSAIATACAAGGCATSSSITAGCSGISKSGSSASGSDGPRRAASSTAASPPKRRRTNRAWSSSRELECVFFSEMPSSGRTSIIAWGLTSSSLASSLMRILLILYGSGVALLRRQNYGISRSAPFNLIFQLPTYLNQQPRARQFLS